LRELIECVARVRALDPALPVHALVIGRGRAAPYERLARRRGCREVIRFLPAAPDVRPYYAAADLLLQPTYYDPCSMATLEALACGLPVVTTRFNGAGELIEPGVHGYVVDDPREVEALARSVLALRDAQVRARCGEAARRLAEAQAVEQNYRAMAARFEAVGRGHGADRRHAHPPHQSALPRVRG
jgi:UDP-glucose:(heptosyl)LPS alpha-1,3-glucosyltransferase